MTYNVYVTGGCEYFYQLNDDIKLVTPGWAEELVETLRSSSYLPNLGITGPLDTNNPRLMTHSFAHTCKMSFMTTSHCKSR